MTAAPEIPREVLERQRGRLRSSGLGLVSANAGSGKTYVLAQRVIRLLLGGTPPGKTSASPSPRRPPPTCDQRVRQARAWTALDDRSLDDSIYAMSSERPQPERRARARAPLRPGPGDAGRPQGADHPCVLHPAAAAVSVRGPTCRRASRCSTRRPNRNCSISSLSMHCWKVPPTGRRARPRARDRHRVGERSDLSGRVERGDPQAHGPDGLDRSGRRHRGRDRGALGCARPAPRRDHARHRKRSSSRTP